MPAATARAPRAKSVFLVDDDADDLFLIKRAVAASNWRSVAPLDISCFSNGLDALSAVARRDLLSDLPDLVIIDLNMPVLDGMTFLAGLRSLLHLDVRVVVLTTSEQKPVLDAALEAGADEVFVKPNSQQELFGVVRKIFAAPSAPPGAGSLSAVNA